MPLTDIDGQRLGDSTRINLVIETCLLTVDASPATLGFNGVAQVNGAR